MADYYSNEAVPPAAPAEAPAPREESARGENNVAVLPKSFFPPDKDLTPGNECKVRVEEVQEDGVLVSYAHSDESAPAEAPATDEEMQSYMS